jgi:hypothetical protein
MTKQDTRTASATKMAEHLGLNRAYLDKLVQDSVISRRPDGRFDLDRTRLAYIVHLRKVRRTSPQTTARAAFDQAKADDLAVRSAIRNGTLMEVEDALAIVDELMGLMLAALSGLAARVTRDMQVRHAIDAEIFNLRSELAAKCSKRAAELEKESTNDRHARNDSPRGNRTVRRPRVHGIGSVAGQVNG